MLGTLTCAHYTHGRNRSPGKQGVSAEAVSAEEGGDQIEMSMHLEEGDNLKPSAMFKNLLHPPGGQQGGLESHGDPP